HNINILVISTSEIKISVLIAEEFTELALRALHTAYGLDAA
ncbi:MAG: aspartate kinase, partial [Alphaproteobacteria bacterium]